MESPDGNHADAGRGAKGSLGPLLLFSNPPERTHSEPCEGRGKTNRDGKSGGACVPRVVFAVLLDTGAGQADGHHEKQYSHHLQPQLVKHISK